MRYRLVVLTHGREDTLSRCLESFAESVSPAPTEAILHSDGGDASGRAYEAASRYPGWNWTLSESFQQLGFCRATREAWIEARTPGVDYVFWLEHDFEFRVPIDLTALAEVLDATPFLAQLALVRGPANVEELAAGGLVAARPHTFAPQRTRGHGWLRHDAFWTTNPSLFPREVCADHDWPVAEFCEGVFSIEMRERGYSFGLWGAGSQQVDHVGRRSGFGY